MTNQFNPETGLATQAVDVNGLQGIQGAIPLQRALPGARFEIITVEQAKGTIGWRLTIFDLRGGLNMQRGEVVDAHTRLSYSTAESRAEGYLHPPYLATKQNTITPTTPDTLFWAIFLKRLVMATTGGPGALAASKLLAETSVTDATLIDRTYTFLGGTACYGLWKLFINNSTSERLAVGSSGNLDILSDLAAPPTSLGQVAAAGVTGLLQFQQPDLPFLVAAGTDLKRGLGSGAIGQALSTVASNLTAGRKDIASFSYGGRKARAFWLVPDGLADVATLFGSTGGTWHIESTDPYGTDPQYHDVGIDKLIWAKFVRDGLICSNGDRIVFNDGRKPDELGWKSDRKYSSSTTLTAVAVHIIDKREVIIDVVERASGAVTNWWQERFDWDLRSWSQCSETIPLTGANNLISARGLPDLPFSPSTRMVHSAGGSSVTDPVFVRRREPPPGVNPYSERGQQSFAAASVTRLPGMLFPAPLTYIPKEVTGVFMGGDATGGAALTGSAQGIKIEIGEMGFTAGTGYVSRYGSGGNTRRGRQRLRPQNQTRILMPQIEFTLTQGSDATLIPQPLPVTIEGVGFLPQRKKKNWLPW